MSRTPVHAASITAAKQVALGAVPHQIECFSTRNKSSFLASDDAV